MEKNYDALRVRHSDLIVVSFYGLDLYD